jgi:hypothetical protein
MCPHEGTSTDHFGGLALLGSAGVPATDVLEFTADHRGDLVARLDDLAGTGRGWVNLLPEVSTDGEDTARVLPPRVQQPGVLGGVFATLFTSRGPGVPMATWTAPSRRGSKIARVGIEHGAGPKAKLRLAQAGHAVPARWRVVQDHPRTGLVVDPAPSASTDEVVAWLLGAVGILCPVRLSGAWLAEIHPG